MFHVRVLEFERNLIFVFVFTPSYNILPNSNKKKGRIINNNGFDFETGKPYFLKRLSWKLIYREAKDYLLYRDNKNNLCKEYGKGQQKNGFTGKRNSDCHAFAVVPSLIPPFLFTHILYI